MTFRCKPSRSRTRSCGSQHVDLVGLGCPFAPLAARHDADEIFKGMGLFPQFRIGGSATPLRQMLYPRRSGERESAPGVLYLQGEFLVMPQHVLHPIVTAGMPFLQISRVKRLGHVESPFELQPSFRQRDYGEPRDAEPHFRQRAGVVGIDDVTRAQFRVQHRIVSFFASYAQFQAAVSHLGIELLDVGVLITGCSHDSLRTRTPTEMLPKVLPVEHARPEVTVVRIKGDNPIPVARHPKGGMFASGHTPRRFRAIGGRVIFRLGI